ncbi:Adenylate kinase [Halobacillus karajensis]|uniref:topology modulation protein n=1 Tax=Halobacillus karajensis TaxID=195088 RepID=UPI0008A7EE17|nr:topology modulation protein [Halobacillus karajensis]SEI07407.1 Adenylate kinase [Halobacillus karajensis]
MNRIMVLGVSSGVGKSTFAKRLGEKLSIEVYHLDRFYWEPGWKEADSADFEARQKNVIDQDQWVIEGNYSSTYELRAAKADTIIYLELPLAVCLFRVVKRWWFYKGKTRTDMGEGCAEKLDTGFLKFILTTYGRRKKKMQERLKAFQDIGREKRVIQLRSKSDIQMFLDTYK